MTMMYFLVRNFVKLFFMIFMGFKVKGRQKVPKEGAFILAGNHVSHLDPPALSAASPRILYFMARHTLFDNRLFGWLIGSCNAFPVRRGEADMGAMKKAIRLLKSGKPLLIFPEGTRSETGDMNRAQPGMGYLSLMSGAPVLTAYVDGTQEAMPKGTHGIKLKKISVYSGDLIDPGTLGLPDDKKEAAQRLSEYVIEEIKKLGDTVKKQKSKGEGSNKEDG
jgi:1-acyl-sn-glycerol-3-phosphate acyltransferase